VLQEKADDEHQREFAKEWEPMRQHFKRSYMADLYASPDFTSQAMATQDAEALLRDVKPADSRPEACPAPDKPESN